MDKKFIQRVLADKILNLAKKYLLIGIFGPRQSGKTTLCRHIFPDFQYVSLEDFDVREFAKTDPRGFLGQFEGKPGVILDEVQRVPELFSYLQSIVDTKPRPGFFILTGSQNFLLMQNVSQSLAGRIAVLTLLPLCLQELKKAHLLPNNEQEVLFNGFYPRIWADSYEPFDWYKNYTTTYLERDVRQIINVKDLVLFKRFLGLCAGRIGQLLNVSGLANDCGISVSAANAWLSILEASYIIFRLPPYFKNFSKRLIKSPKLFFYDTGLACSILNIENYQDLSTHYLRGALFESFVLAEFLKDFYNHNLEPKLYFWRDQTGHEIDGILERSQKMFAVEIKAGKTVTQDYFKGLRYWAKLTGNSSANSYVVYAGSAVQVRKDGKVVGWQSIPDIMQSIYDYKKF